MAYTFIGLIVGIIMGLTGAGGALISIPLFLTILNTTVKEATVLSLLAVVMGTSINLLGQFKKTDKQIVFTLSFFGMLSNYLSLPLKKSLPDIAIALMLTMIGIYSIWSVWKKRNSRTESTTQLHFLGTAVIGLAIGLITTMTGLGGGVLLVPILIGFFNKSYSEALPTSLLTILIISFVSLLLQLDVARHLITLSETLLIAAGALSAFFFLKWILGKLHPHHIERARKMVFSLVTIYAIISVILKSM